MDDKVLEQIEEGYKTWLEYVEAMARGGAPVPPNFAYCYGYLDIMTQGIAQLRVAIARKLEMPAQCVNVVMQPDLQERLRITGMDVNPPADWLPELDKGAKEAFIQSTVASFFELAQGTVRDRLAHFMRIRKGLLPDVVIGFHSDDGAQETQKQP